MSVFLLCLANVTRDWVRSIYVHFCLITFTVVWFCCLFTFRLPCGLKRYIRCVSCRRKYPLFSESTFTQMLSLNECTPVLALKGFHFVICFVFLLCLANMTRDLVRSNCFVLLTFRLPCGLERYMICGSRRRNYPFLSIFVNSTINLTTLIYRRSDYSCCGRNKS